MTPAAPYPDARVASRDGTHMTPGAALALFALLMFAALVPVWPWSRGWSWRPAIAFGVLFTAAVMVWVTVLI